MSGLTISLAVRPPGCSFSKSGKSHLTYQPNRGGIWRATIDIPYEKQKAVPV